MPLKQESEDKIVLIGDEARNKVHDGARTVYELVRQVYGPRSGNVALELGWGKPVASHDGITVARKVMLRDRAKNIGAQWMIEASQRTNDYVGDGTTCTVILAHHLIEAARKRIASGYNPMALRKGLNDAAAFIVGRVRELAEHLDDSELHKIATISASDEAIGKLVAQTLIDVGENGGVSVEEWQGLGIDQEVVDGFHYDRGYHAVEMANGPSVAKYENVKVVVCDKSLQTIEDILPLLQLMQNHQIQNMFVVADVSGDALNVMVQNKLNPVAVNFLAVGIPVYGNLRAGFIEDVAVYTGAKPLRTLVGVTVADLGEAAKVVSTAEKTTITGGSGDPESVQNKIDEVQKLLAEETTNEFLRERYTQRLARLTGKLAILRVGGATETEAKELKFRVDDAVCATRAAREEGIVPGGGTTLARLSSAIYEADTSNGGRDEYEGWLIMQEALKQPFLTLCANAGLDGSYLLRQVLDSPAGHGFDLRNPGEKPKELAKAGVIDPAKVIRMVVENATSVASNIITCNAVVVYDDEKAS